MLNKSIWELKIREQILHVRELIDLENYEMHTYVFNTNGCIVACVILKEITRVCCDGQSALLAKTGVANAFT